MATTIDRAIERMRALPADRQEQFAQFLLHELETDDAWARSTAAHADAVGRLVADLRADDARGITEPLDPDRL